MKAYVYKVECLTNLHVGNGDINYSVVDKEVELDLVLGTPSIYSSGVKGALRDYFEELVKSNVIDAKVVNAVFGDPDEKTKGSYKFLSADLIARPMRVSTGKVSFVNVATKEMVDHHLNLLESLDEELYKGIYADTDAVPELNGFDFITSDKVDITEIEGYPVGEKKDSALLTKLIGSNWALTSSDTFRAIKLPVLARNVLSDGGKSENLWYEEVVPHKSIFMLTIITPGDENLLDKQLDGAVVQFGGNASIGYGLTKITKIKKEGEGSEQK